MSSPERHARVKEVFLALCEEPPEARAKALDEACSGDEELRREGRPVEGSMRELANRAAMRRLLVADREAAIALWRQARALGGFEVDEGVVDAGAERGQAPLAGAEAGRQLRLAP